MFDRSTGRVAKRHAPATIMVLVAVALLAAVTRDAVAGPPGQRPGSVALASEPAQLELRPCLSQTLELAITNESSEARFVDVYVRADAPLDSSKTVISTYVPADARVTVDVRIAAPQSTPGGEYEVRFTQGRRERLTVPVTVSAPTDRLCLPREQMTAAATSAQLPTYGPENVLDGDLATIWHTKYSPTRDPLPQSITLDLGGRYDVAELSYQPRVDGNINGAITAYNVYASSDGQTFTRVANGTWAADASRKSATLEAADTRYLRLEAIEGYGGFASAAEIVLFGRPAGS